MKKFLTLIIIAICLLIGSCNSNNSSSLSLAPVKQKRLDLLNMNNKPNRNMLNVSLDTKKIGWGLGNIKDELNRPTDSLDANKKYNKYDAFFIDEKSKKITLTFDQGYENGYTDKIINVLNDKNVQAIFFITYEYVKDQPDLVKKMLDSGHIIGNHSYRHKSMPEISVAEQETEIMTLHDYMEDKFNYTMKLFRPPMGEFSEQSLATAKNVGYTSMFWSFAYLDYLVQQQPAPDESLNKIVENAHPGAIYLLHSVSKTNADILDKAIDKIREKGFEI